MLNNLYDGRAKKCPLCGNKIIHQHTGCLTEEQEKENWDCCLWIDVVDEGRSTIGYEICCKQDWPPYESLYEEK